MTVEELSSAFADKSLTYDAFEYGELVKAIKGCDNQLIATFFPNTVLLSTPNICSKIAVKLVCYTIAKTTSYGFNKCIRNIDYSTAIGQILLGNADLDTWVFRRFMDEIVGSDGLTDELKKQFFSAITTDHYVHGTFSEVIAGKRQKAVLLFKFVKTYLPEKYNEFYTVYKNVNSSQTKVLAETGCFQSYLQDDRLWISIKSDVTAAIERQTNVQDYVIREKAHSYYCAGEAFTVPAVVYTHHEYDVGAAVLTWLNSDAVRCYDLRSDYVLDNHIHNIDKKTEHSGGGCVTGETLITMKDGKGVPIMRLIPGMEVRSAGGVSVLSDEFIVNRHLKMLYGINDIKPFMSPEHAVMTTEGWKSLDPEKSNRINAYYDVTLLRQGDEVVTLDGTLRVDKITVERAAPGKTFTGYDLHFANGEKSYYANGLLVLLNYPDITLARLMRALEGMETSRRRRFFTLFQTEQALFEELFSGELIVYFKECAYEKFKDDFCEQS